MATRSERSRVDELLDDARARIERMEPQATLAAARAGALIVDIRTDADRERDGIAPGSLHIPRTVLEWRLDPGSPWKNPHVQGFERQIVLLCDHGYASGFAAATLVELGYARVGEVIGGFAAWRHAGLPTVPAPPAARQPSEPAGMDPPARSS